MSDDQLPRLIAELAVRRRLLGLSQGELGNRIGYSMATVRSWENGYREMKLRALLDYAAAVDVRVKLIPTRRDGFIIIEDLDVTDDGE